MKRFLHRSVCGLLIAAAPLWGVATPTASAQSPATQSPATQSPAANREPPVANQQTNPQPTPSLAKARVEAVAIRLAPDRILRGTIRTPKGLPAAHCPVVLGVQGRPIGRTKADAEGRFQFGPIAPGEYQLATKDAAAMITAYSLDSAPDAAKSSIEVSRNAMIARGQSPASILSNPWFIALTVAAAAAIPVGIALADDDDDAS